jgi:hypothetical protein
MSDASLPSFAVKLLRDFPPALAGVPDFALAADDACKRSAGAGLADASEEGVARLGAGLEPPFTFHGSWRTMLPVSSARICPGHIRPR